MEKQIKKSRLRGTVKIPASKSHTIRALLIASLAEGKSIIRNPLLSGDTYACINACRYFGAEIEEKNENLHITGLGGKPLTPSNIIDVNNSGTTLYLAAGVAALCEGITVFTGDQQIRSRPIQPLIKSLNDLGARAETSGTGGRAPVIIRGPLTGGETSIECPTSQYLSSLLLCTPLGKTNSRIIVPLLHEKPYVEMTLKWLDEQDIKYSNENFKSFVIPGNQSYKSFSKTIPGDFSSAAFFLCAAAITGSELTLEGLDMEDSQGDKAIVEILGKMGSPISIVGDKILIEQDSGRGLTGCDIDLNSIPDALPALAVAGCYAKGTTRLLNVPQARLKETDRIAVMKRELTKMGAVIRELPDGLEITGGQLKGADVNGHSDHRVVMALAIAGLNSTGRTTIDSTEAVDITFPGFFNLLEEISYQEKSSNCWD